MLLRSRPDTVHRVPLRKTQTSTPLMKGSSTAKLPRLGITPAVADCRYRAPLSPRLHGNHYYTDFDRICQSTVANHGVPEFLLDSFWFCGTITEYSFPVRNIWRDIEVVITSRTRNAGVRLRARGFESHSLRRRKPCTCRASGFSFLKKCN